MSPELQAILKSCSFKIEKLLTPVEEEHISHSVVDYKSMYKDHMIRALLEYVVNTRPDIIDESLYHGYTKYSTSLFVCKEHEFRNIVEMIIKEIPLERLLKIREEE